MVQHMLQCVAHIVPLVTLSLGFPVAQSLPSFQLWRHVTEHIKAKKGSHCAVGFASPLP